MDKLERQQHLLHSQLPAFARKLDRTRSLIGEAMALGISSYLSFSTGTDSTVLLDLLWQAGYQMDVVFGDDGADFSESLDFLHATEQRYGFAAKRIRCMAPWRSWCIEMARPDLCDDPPAQAAWLNPHVWDATWDSLKDARHEGYVSVFLGMLASESRTRRYALQGGYKPLYQVKSEEGMWHCSPLAAWTKADIWSYIVANNLPYNPVYDTLAALGVPLEHRRVAPLTCYRVLQYGSGIILRQGWPELHMKLCEMFPRLCAY